MTNTQGMYYLHRDLPGSVLGVTDASGSVVREGSASFDAWGNRRDPSTWQPFDRLPAPLMFDRGFTGHEHYESFGIIDMNGRCYDPAVGRFLSPDLFVQQPGFSQSYNRYSYCLNNPLNYVDPGGFEYEEEYWDSYSGHPDNPPFGFKDKPQQVNGSIEVPWFLIMEERTCWPISHLEPQSIDHLPVDNTMSVHEFSAMSNDGSDYFARESYPEPFESFDPVSDFTYDMGDRDGMDGDDVTQGQGGWDSNGDGKLQKSEADNHWFHGGGVEISVDNSKIDWTGLKIPASAKVGKVFSINTTQAFLKLPYETAATYGGTSFILKGPHSVEVVDQLYHYQYRPNNSAENLMRNFMNWYGKPVGQGTDYMIHYVNPLIIIK